MATFAVYNDATRRILRTGSCAASDIALQAQAGESVIQCAANVSDGTHYVHESGVPVLKKSLAASWDKQSVAAGGLDEAVLSSLPIPCTVTVDWQTKVDVFDGTFEFRADSPGEYLIVVDEVEYLRQEWEIEAD